MPLSNRHGKKNSRAINGILANPSRPLPMPGLEPALVQRPSKASVTNPTHEHESRRPRPYLFETLQASLLTRIIADTLDWDGKL